jgi:hypothetical protein
MEHVYKAAGTYEALLIKDACPDNVQCIWAGETVGKTTIVVKNSDNTPSHGHDWPATTTPNQYHGWWNWFANFHFKFWSFWK